MSCGCALLFALLRLPSSQSILNFGSSHHNNNTSKGGLLQDKKPLFVRPYVTKVAVSHTWLVRIPREYRHTLLSIFFLLCPRYSGCFESNAGKGTRKQQTLTPPHAVVIAGRPAMRSVSLVALAVLLQAAHIAANNLTALTPCTGEKWARLIWPTWSHGLFRLVHT